MLFDHTDFDYEIDFFKIPGSDFSKEIRVTKFLSPEEGFAKGNLTANEYVPYKNYSYATLKPTTEREKLLFQLMTYSFAINDLNLYLDLNPEDKETYNLFKKYVHIKNELEEQYSNLYGPMTVTETQQEMFSWVKNPWPWDRTGDSKYV